MVTWGRNTNRNKHHNYHTLYVFLVFYRYHRIYPPNALSTHRIVTSDTSIDRYMRQHLKKCLFPVDRVGINNLTRPAAKSFFSEIWDNH